MRRLAPALLAVLALATPASAAPQRQQINDAKGDWPVASLDVLSAKLSSVLVKGKPMLRAELHLAAAPDAAPSTYSVGFSVGCHGYTFDRSWAPQTTHVALAHDDYCHPENEPPGGHVGPDEEFPATVTVKGSVVTWQAPYVGQVRRGAHVQGMLAWACSRVCTGLAFDSSDMRTVGDLAMGEIDYVVGSDLPRR